MLKKASKTAGNSAESPQNEPNPPKAPLFDLGALSKPLAGAEARGPLVPLEKLDLNELLDLRSQIDERLPPRRLADLDLEEEVMLQFARTKLLYNNVIADGGTPANQRAQVANSCTAILDQLIKMQTRLYDAGRVQALEQALVRTMREQPEAVQERFFELYERNLAAAAVAKT